MTEKINGRYSTLNLYDNEEELAQICSCLSVKTRRDILKLVSIGTFTINQIANKLSLPLSTASFHIKSLEKAGIVHYFTATKHVGNEKYVVPGKYIFAFNLFDYKNVHSYKNERVSYDIPIGSYVNYKVGQYCGIYMPDKILLCSDTPAVFASPERFKAGLIWTNEGFFEYTIPLLDFMGSKTNNVYHLSKKTIVSLAFSFEICSEAPIYKQEYKSDIDFYVNEIKVCSFTLEGDFGERRGKLNPPSFPDHFTQYGLLYSVDVRFDGTYLNEKRVSDVCIENLSLTEKDVLSFRIENPLSAKHKGGFNLFGKTFGDYKQDISLNVTYQNIITKVFP